MVVINGTQVSEIKGSIEKAIITEINKQPCTIEDVSRLLGIHRVTASKYLAVLEAKNVLQYRPVGKAKLYSMREKT